MSLFTSGLPSFLLQSLKRIGIDTPTNIQSQAIPVILDGKDALITAHTGSGKTLAYLIPKIIGIANGCKRKILILAPTRELSTQIGNVAKSCLADSQIKVANLIGGQSMVIQLKQLTRQPQIIIGTPGRVLDHLERKSLRLDDVGCFILDEVDRMLDLGFSSQIEQIEKKLPQVRQNLMFSATLPAKTVKLVEKYLKDYVRIDDGQVNKPAPKIEHSFEKIAHQAKFQTLIEQLTLREGAVLIFVNRKIDAQKVSDRLRDEGLSADSIHGDLRQGVRDRIIQKFRDQKIRIMVGTDVVARGLDVSHIRHVINYDLPICPEDYLHRIGRTGRAGEAGSAFSMVSPQDGLKLRAIQRLLNPELSGQDEEARTGYGSSRRRSSDSFRSNRSNSSSYSSNRRFTDRSSSSEGRRSFDRSGFSGSPRFGRSSTEERPSFRRPDTEEQRPRSFEDASQFGRPGYDDRRNFTRPNFERGNSDSRPRFDRFRSKERNSSRPFVDKNLFEDGFSKKS
jgi:superfamily II DNA/RNA helicase